MMHTDAIHNPLRPLGVQQGLRLYVRRDFGAIPERPDYFWSYRPRTADGNLGRHKHRYVRAMHEDGQWCGHAINTNGSVRGPKIVVRHVLLAGPAFVVIKQVE